MHQAHRPESRLLVRAPLLLLALLAAAPVRASTVAEYFFNGSASYNASTGQITVGTDATVFDSANLPTGLSVIKTGAGANVVGSAVNLSMVLTPGTVIDTGAFTIASFGANPAQPTVSLYLGNGSGGTSATPVLTGVISNAQIVGQDGVNAGVLTAYLHPTGGLAGTYFSDPSNVIALNFDLTTTFGPTMYTSSFSGQINGQIQAVSPAVPLPAAGWLLASGLCAGALRLRRRPEPNPAGTPSGDRRA